MAAAAGNGANSPTLTMAATRARVILGTAGYMSPEQTRGAPVDKRADIWAFGVVLYEMLTGRVTFAGETVPDTLASVLKSEIDFAALPAETPASVRRVLRRCLERDRKRRMDDIADVLSLDRLGKSETLIGGSFAKAWPQFSPDGRWLAYMSTESGRPEIYVQSHPPGRGKGQVSQAGCLMARWRRDGNELVFHQGDGRFLAVEVRRRGEALEFGKPVPLFETNMSLEAGQTYFAMTGDGPRFALQAPLAPLTLPKAPGRRPWAEWMAGLPR